MRDENNTRLYVLLFILRNSVHTHYCQLIYNIYRDVNLIIRNNVSVRLTFHGHRELSFTSYCSRDPTHWYNYHNADYVSTMNSSLARARLNQGKRRFDAQKSASCGR